MEIKEILEQLKQDPEIKAQIDQILAGGHNPDLSGVVKSIIERYLGADNINPDTAAIIAFAKAEMKPFLDKYEAAHPPKGWFGRSVHKLLHLVGL